MIIIYCIVLDIILILSGGVATIFDRVILLDAFWGLQNESLKPSRHIRLAFCACLFFHCTRRIHRRLREPGSDATGDQHGWRDDALRSLWHCPLGWKMATRPTMAVEVRMVRKGKNVLQVERIGVIWGGRISWILGSTVLKLPQILACFVGKSSRMAGFYQRPNPDFLRYISLRPTGEKRWNIAQHIFHNSPHTSSESLLRIRMMETYPYKDI